MTTLWFLYTVSLFAAALVSCSLSLAVWMAAHRRDCLAAAAGFFIYAMEIALIFFDEYARAKFVYPDSFEEPLTHPFESAALSVLLCAALWVWMLMRLRVSPTRMRVVVPIVVYAVVAFVLVPKAEMSGTLQQWAYRITRDLTTLGMLGYAWWRYRHAKTERERLDLARSRRFFKVACVLAVCVAAEDTFMILLCRPPFEILQVSEFFWPLPERNILENILMIACAIQLARNNRRVLSMYFNHPPVGEVVSAAPVEDARPVSDGASAATAATIASTVDAADASEGASQALATPIVDATPVFSDDMTSRILLYCDKNKLSVRERDVLEQVLAGKDTRNIASALVISPGTVKAHLHRIYHKVGVTRREDLVRDFWKP